MNQPLPLLFSIRSYQYLKEAIAAHGGFENGNVEVKIFPDGERYQRVATPVAGREVILIGGTCSDAETLELYDLSYALVKYGAARFILVIPYFGYSTMERASKAGDVVTAKTRARLLSSIPQAAGGNLLVLLDLHSEGLPHYFEGELTPVHLYSHSLILKTISQIAKSDYVLGCTDAGRAKWVQSLAIDAGTFASFVFKRRIDDRHTEVYAISGQVSGKQVIIYDDMIRTGCSLINAAKAYKNAGAADICVITTHGIFAGDALKRLKETGLISKIICTDSHPNVIKIDDEFLEIKSVAELFANYLKTNLR